MDFHPPISLIIHFRLFFSFKSNFCLPYCNSCCIAWIKFKETLLVLRNGLVSGIDRKRWQTFGYSWILIKYFILFVWKSTSGVPFLEHTSKHIPEMLLIQFSVDNFQMLVDNELVIFQASWKLFVSAVLKGTVLFHDNIK